MSTAPRYAGVSLVIADVTYVLPAMNAGTLEMFEERIGAVQKGTEPRPVSLTADLVHRALQRNHPGLQREVVADHVDLDNWEELFAALMGQAGYKQWAEMAAEQGNARALQILQAMPGAGAPSTPTSPPASAGPSTTAAST